MVCGIWCAIPPLGRALSDSEEHAHTVQRRASTHHLPPEKCPLQAHRTPVSAAFMCPFMSW